MQNLSRGDCRKRRCCHDAPGAAKPRENSGLTAARACQLSWTAAPLALAACGENTTTAPLITARSPAAPARSPRTGSRAPPCSRRASRRRGLPPAARRRPAPPLAGVRRRRGRARAECRAGRARRQIVSASGAPAYQCHTSDASTRCQRETSPAREQEVDGGGGGAAGLPLEATVAESRKSRESGRPPDAARDRAGGRSRRLKACGGALPVVGYPGVIAPTTAAVISVASVPETIVLAPRLTISARRCRHHRHHAADQDAEAAEVGKAAQRVGEDQARAIRQRAGGICPSCR